jgi:predicted dehydrogenase
MNKKYSPLKLGFIGGGLSSAIGQTHFAACRLDGHWDLVCGAFSRHADINQATAETWHIDPKRLYADWRQMLDTEKELIDAIVLLTPTPNHAVILCELLRLEIPVICEKAMVSSLLQLAEVKKLYNPTKHFLAVTYNYSGYPMVRELQEKIQNGEFGNIQQIHLEMPQEGFIRPPDIAGKSSPPQSWRLADDIIPTICLDLGVHLHHLMVFLLGEEPSKVMAEFSHYSPFAGIVDNASLWLKFASGKSASFWMTKTAIGSRNGLKLLVYGDKGSAEWIQALPEELSLSNINGIRTKIDRGSKMGLSSQNRYNRMKVGHPAGFIEAFANLYQDIAEALVEWRESGTVCNQFVYGYDHAAKGLLLFHQARKSHEIGQWVDISEDNL